MNGLDPYGDIRVVVLLFILIIIIDDEWLASSISLCFVAVDSTWIGPLDDRAAFFRKSKRECWTRDHQFDVVVDVVETTPGIWIDAYWRTKRYCYFQQPRRNCYQCLVSRSRLKDQSSRLLDGIVIVCPTLTSTKAIPRQPDNNLNGDVDCDPNYFHFHQFPMMAVEHDMLMTMRVVVLSKLLHHVQFDLNWMLPKKWKYMRGCKIRATENVTSREWNVYGKYYNSSSA